MTAPKKGERQSVYRSVSFSAYSQFTDNLLLHISESLRRGRRSYAAHLTIACGTRCQTQKRPSSTCKGRLPFPFSKRSHIGNLRRIRKQGKGRSSKRKENRRLSFLFAPAAGRGTFPPSADGESPAEVQRKTLRPERDEHAYAVRVPRSAGAEKTAAR